MSSDLFVKFWGTRGSIPTPGEHTRRYGGNTSCVEVRLNDTLIICDAGSGIRGLGDDLLDRSPGPITGHLLFSHSHWDHIQGFPFFAPAYIPENRFFIYGRNPGDDRFYRLLSGQMESDYFPISFSSLKAAIRAEFLRDSKGTIGGIQVECLDVDHPGGAIAYALSAGGRRIVYATDCELRWQPDFSPRVLREMRVELVNFCRGADLLIADGQYTDDEYALRIGWGHSSGLSAVDLAVRAGASKLALFHHDPARSDTDLERLVDTCLQRAEAHASPLSVFAAREGVEFRFPSKG
jgi:phosphoribosyl 1,2-cyclic phosphodiesterase